MSGANTLPQFKDFDLDTDEARPETPSEKQAQAFRGEGDEEE